MWPTALLKLYNTLAVQATFVSGEGKLSPSIICCWGLPQQEVLATGMEFSERVLSAPLYNVPLEGPRVLGVGRFLWQEIPTSLGQTCLGWGLGARFLSPL